MVGRYREPNGTCASCPLPGTVCTAEGVDRKPSAATWLLAAGRSALTDVRRCPDGRKKRRGASAATAVGTVSKASLACTASSATRRACTGPRTTPSARHAATRSHGGAAGSASARGSAAAAAVHPEATRITCRHSFKEVRWERGVKASRVRVLAVMVACTRPQLGVACTRPQLGWHALGHSWGWHALGHCRGGMHSATAGDGGMHASTASRTGRGSIVDSRAASR